MLGQNRWPRLPQIPAWADDSLQGPGDRPPVPPAGCLDSSRTVTQTYSPARDRRAQASGRRRFASHNHIFFEAESVNFLTHPPSIVPRFVSHKDEPFPCRALALDQRVRPHHLGMRFVDIRVSYVEEIAFRLRSV